MPGMMATPAYPRTVPVGRLAPSPTGAQHVGNARTYLLAWLSLRSRGGRVLLRIEDIDSPRIKPWATQQAIDDLAWLGLDWDEGPDLGGPHGPYIQTERLASYTEALQRLQAMEAVYPCRCTRADVAAAASAPHVGQEGPVYPGTCAGRTANDARDLAGQPYCWRFRTAGTVDEFADGFMGDRVCDVGQDLGDFVVWKTDGGPAYQLAVVVDDQAMGVTEVCRGDDLLPSAHRQRLLYRAFGWTPPEFVHVPLVVGPDGRRLAKRHGDTRIALLRERGVPAERLIGFLAWSCRLRATREPVTARSLLPDFDNRTVPAEPFVMTDADWKWLLRPAAET